MGTLRNFIYRIKLFFIKKKPHKIEIKIKQYDLYYDTCVSFQSRETGIKTTKILRFVSHRYHKMLMRYKYKFYQ